MRLSGSMVYGYAEVARSSGRGGDANLGRPSRRTNPKHPARNSKQIRNPNVPAARNVAVEADRCFGLRASDIRACFEFRDSDFELPAARVAPNKANFRRFWPKNADQVRKQTQSTRQRGEKPIQWVPLFYGVSGSTARRGYDRRNRRVIQEGPTA